ncbi:exported hypothetical protein [Nitrolancea hollandica Lb]|uniref:Uncharacterized protein n=2 Tax=Nitrolancea hollandica TaxID=1206749 RepID=I4EKE2_9BACT|nr:exported hypothetical protein [Nitrolancea hollandica Lb]
MGITAVIFLLVMLLLDIGGFIAHGVSYPLAAVLIIGYNVVQAYVIRLVARRRH